jgi:hypothetical protein
MCDSNICFKQQTTDHPPSRLFGPCEDRTDWWLSRPIEKKHNIGNTIPMEPSSSSIDSGPPGILPWQNEVRSQFSAGFPNMFPVKQNTEGFPWACEDQEKEPWEAHGTHGISSNGPPRKRWVNAWLLWIVHMVISYCIYYLGQTQWAPSIVL